jgi:hypothetical protein
MLLRPGSQPRVACAVATVAADDEVVELCQPTTAVVLRRDLTGGHRPRPRAHCPTAGQVSLDPVGMVGPAILGGESAVSDLAAQGTAVVRHLGGGVGSRRWRWCRPPRRR